MFALIRVAYFCLLACLLQWRLRQRAFSLLAPSDSSLYVAPSVSPLYILPHRALPPAEPFNLRSRRVPTEITTKWSELQSRISADEKTLRLAAQANVLARRLDFAFCYLLNLLENAKGAPGWAGSIVRLT